MIERFFERIKDLIPEKNIYTVLDLGSRDGLESIEFSKRYPEASIFAFECHPQSIQKCLENTRGFSNIKVVGKAVHEINGRCKFYPIDAQKSISTSVDGNPGASSLFLASGEYDPVEKYVQYEIEVEATRLDTWAGKEGVNRFDLVWMDLQGAELLAFNGMGGLIDSVKAIHTEVSMVDIYKGQSLFSEINKFLVDRDFQLIDADLDARYFTDAIYIRNNLLANNAGRSGMEEITVEEIMEQIRDNIRKRNGIDRDLKVLNEDWHTLKKGPFPSEKHFLGPFISIIKWAIWKLTRSYNTMIFHNQIDFNANMVRLLNELHNDFTRKYNLLSDGMRLYKEFQLKISQNHEKLQSQLWQKYKELQQENILEKQRLDTILSGLREKYKLES